MYCTYVICVGVAGNSVIKSCNLVYCVELSLSPVDLQYKHVQEGLQKVDSKHALQVSPERWWVCPSMGGTGQCGGLAVVCAC